MCLCGVCERVRLCVWGGGACLEHVCVCGRVWVHVCVRVLARVFLCVYVCICGRVYVVVWVWMRV